MEAKRKINEWEKVSIRGGESDADQVEFVQGKAEAREWILCGSAQISGRSVIL